MERFGKGSRKVVEKLVAPPEHPLSVEEANEAFAYEGQICDHLVDEDLSIEKLIRTRKSETPLFFADAFLRGQVQIPGLEGQIRQHRTAEDVYRWLAQAAHDGTITPEDFRELSRQSIAYYKTEVKQLLLRGENPDEHLLNAMSIAIEPEKVLHFARADQEARAYLMKQRKKYSYDSGDLEGAKRAFVDIYTKKINGSIASDIKSVNTLIQQSRLIGDEETISEAYMSMPADLTQAADNKGSRHRLYERLDYISNGIGYDENGFASGVDAQVFADIAQKAQEQEVKESEPVFTKEERQRLRETLVDKETIHEIEKGIVADAGMLSSEDESTWKPGRGYRAEDGLFQVVRQPIKDTMAVDGADGVFKTPNIERSLYDLITITNHELVHINQAQADLALSRVLRIAAVKGRRVSTLRETGANLVQREVEHVLFGESKPVAFAYARALQAFAAGGNIFTATKAFFEEKVGSGVEYAKAASEAADRVLRLGINGSNSQPMAYAEENIMSLEFANAPPEVRQRATKITTLDLDDQLRLHTYGLLPEVETGDIDWFPIVMNRLQPLIEKALSEPEEGEELEDQSEEWEEDNA